jgi:hypothetical protein
MSAGDRVYSLIPGSESFRNLRGLCLFIIIVNLIIGKAIRSKTPSPVVLVGLRILRVKKREDEISPLRDSPEELICLSFPLEGLSGYKNERYGCEKDHEHVCGYQKVGPHASCFVGKDSMLQEVDSISEGVHLRDESQNTG